jgi:hypothetical protein
MGFSHTCIRTIHAMRTATSTRRLSPERLNNQGRHSGNIGEAGMEPESRDFKDFSMPAGVYLEHVEGPA